jgi:hypothetical protein
MGGAMSTVRRPRWILLVVLVLVFGWAPEAYAQKRVALVIGNSAYRHAPRLNNPKNDAADMPTVLKKHGFEVIEGSDLDTPGWPLGRCAPCVRRARVHHRGTPSTAHCSTGSEAGGVRYCGAFLFTDRRFAFLLLWTHTLREGS